MIKDSGIFEVYIERRKGRKTLYTLNMDKGKDVYGEKLVRQQGKEFREWNHERSKLGAAIMKGVNNIHMKRGSKVLYLGSSTGTTPSHVSDILGKEGELYALDFAPRVVRELVFLAERRENIAPILGDAQQPDTYKDRVGEVEVIFQDIAQSNQVQIFLKNCDVFLKKGGFGMLALKSRSIDVAAKPKRIFKQVRAELEKHMIIVDYKELDPFEKDHAFFICKKR